MPQIRMFVIEADAGVLAEVAWSRVRVRRLELHLSAMAMGEQPEQPKQSE